MSKRLTGFVFLCCLFSSFQMVHAQSVPATPAQISQAARPTTDQVWWKHALIYEIYPRSFQDSNGDGIGDLNGITQRMGYLEKLGVDVIWIAPMFPSPQVDFGYDISDYEAVDPLYGTLADYDRMQAEAGRHHIRVMLDMVLNHTSDKHRWFIESASSRTNPRADWYVWNDGLAADAPGVTAYQKRFAHEGRVPPNNWVSLFGGSAWEWVPARRQFFYHRFYKQQPDLNWTNPEVEKAMFSALRFWLDRGVAGFRLDAITSLYEDPQLRNEPETGGINAQGDPNVSTIYTDNLDAVHEAIKRMRAMVDRYPGHRILLGETYLPNTDALAPWYGDAAGPELHLPMDMLLGFSEFGYSAKVFRRYLGEVETRLNGGQPMIVFDNHDNVRSIDRFGDGTYKQERAKGVAAILLTAKATALTYYGAELGMPTTPPTRKEDVKDPIGITGWPKEKGRDGERTPMQWTPGAQAGFSTDPNTWLPIPPSHVQINAETEAADPNSMLNWYRKLIALRRTTPALHDGGFVMLNPGNESVLSFLRTAPGGAKSVVTVVNMTGAPQVLSLDLSVAGLSSTQAHTLAASHPELAGQTTLNNITLPAFGTWIAELEPAGKKH